MLFGLSDSSCPGELDGVFDFIFSLAERHKRPLFLKITHCEVRTRDALFQPCPANLVDFQDLFSGSLFCKQNFSGNDIKHVVIYIASLFISTKFYMHNTKIIY